MNRKSNWGGDTGDYSQFAPPYLEYQIATSPGMNDDPKAGCIGMIIGIVLAILLLWLLPSCSSSRKALTTTSQSVAHSSGKAAHTERGPKSNGCDRLRTRYRDSE